MPQAIAGGGQICEMNGFAAVVACVFVTGMCIGLLFGGPQSGAVALHPVSVADR